VINKAHQSPRLEAKTPSQPSSSAVPPPKSPKNPITKPKRTKSQTAGSSKGNSQQPLVSRSRKSSAPHRPADTSDSEEPIRPVVKPVRRNSKKAREQAEFAKVAPQQSPQAKVRQNLLQRADSQEEVKHAFQPLPKSAFAPPLDALPIDDTVLKLIASRLPQLSGVSILSEPPAPKKTPRRTSEDAHKVPTVDLSNLPASAIRVPENFNREFLIQKEEQQPKEEEPEAEVKEPEAPEVQVKEESPPESVEEEQKTVSPEPLQEEAKAVVEEELASVEEEKGAEEDLSEAAEEEGEEKSGSSPVPPPPPKTKKDAKAGYFHTAPARPSRLRASVKKRAPLPPINSKAEEDSTKADSAENSQVTYLFSAWSEQ